MIKMDYIFSKTAPTFWAIILVVFYCLGFGVAAMSQEFKQLRIGVDGTYPPFSHRNIEGVFSGFDIDIAAAVCEKLNSKCTLHQFSRDNLVPALRGGKIDMIVATMQVNDATQSLVLLTQPYLQIPAMILVRKDSILSGIEKQDLQDAQLGALKSSSHAEYLRTNYPATHIHLFEKQSDYFLKLANRQLDGIIGDPVLLNNWLETPDGKNCCRILGLLPHEAPINGEGFAIAVHLKQKKLQNALNKTLKSIVKSGNIAKIRRRHLPFLK